MEATITSHARPPQFLGGVYISCGDDCLCAVRVLLLALAACEDHLWPHGLDEHDNRLHC